MVERKYQTEAQRVAYEQGRLDERAEQAARRIAERSRGDDPVVIVANLLFDDEVRRVEIRRSQLSELAAPLPTSEEKVTACPHRNRAIGYDSTICNDCGAFKTDTQFEWGIARDRWFRDRIEAEFYQKNGRLPEPAP